VLGGDLGEKKSLNQCFFFTVKNKNPRKPSFLKMKNKKNIKSMFFFHG
tara:strand:+ start:105 stop:248 length:144 start_codon:yes stop_codon:yes gene_type:complete